MNNARLHRITLIFFLVALGGGITYYLKERSVTSEQQQGPIYDYDAARDRQDVLDFFVTDHHWLLPNNDYDNDLEFMLDYKSPLSKNPLYVGKFIIKVLRENGKFVGFTAYYKKTPNEGFFNFLAVKKEFRGKGYGKLLANYALADMKKMGIKYVTLLTRISNVSAQAVYNAIGFKETGRDDEYVYFDKYL